MSLVTPKYPRWWWWAVGIGLVILTIEVIIYCNMGVANAH